MTSVETHFYFVRHGETDFNVQGIVQGRGVDTPLNPTGFQQAQALARRFATEEVNVVVSSPLTRAMQTAKCVADACGISQVPTHAGLEEISWGVFEGQPQSAKLAQEFDDMKRRWHDGEHDYRVVGGESLREVQSRGLTAVATLLQSYSGRRIVVVAHGRFLRILLASLLEEYGIPRMEELRHSNTGVNYLTHDGAMFKSISLDCTAHL